MKLVLLLLFFLLVCSIHAGSGRFNKAYCLGGQKWGNISTWESLISKKVYRTAQLSTVNTSGTYYLGLASKDKLMASFYLSPTPQNLSLDLGCQDKLPSYSGVSVGTWAPGGEPLWSWGPVGDARKQPRCWWVRCDKLEVEADFCGSEGEAPCSKLDATFTRYTSPCSTPGGPSVDTSTCYPISEDSQIDDTHRVDFSVNFVDGLLG